MNLAVFKRFACGATFAAGASLLAACNSGNVALAPPGPPGGGPKAIAYTAFGASDAVGYNASVPCATPPTSGAVANPTCPGGTGYVPVLAGLLGRTGAAVTLNDLGISADVLGPDIAVLANRYDSSGPNACQPRPVGATVGDFITDELPKLTGGETLVTIFAGGNDTNDIVNAAACQVQLGTLPPANVSAFLASNIQAFGVDLVQLVQSIHTKAPGAKIVLANLPNFAGIPIGATLPLAVRTLLQAVSVGIDTNVYQVAATQSKLPVIDLLCDPRSYDPASFTPGPLADGFHPNDVGYADIAALFFAQITAATPILPQTSCPQMVIVSKAIRPLSGAIPAFDRR